MNLSTNSSNSTSPTSSLDSVDSSKSAWTMWRYNFTDMPFHKSATCIPGKCPFCAELNKIRQSPEGSQLPEEGNHRWVSYLDPVKNFASDKHLMEFLENGEGINSLVANEGISMLELLKSVDFTHKLGTAFFRDGIYPSYDQPINADLTIYRILLFSNTSYSDRPVVRRFDKLFLSLFRWVLALPSPISQHVKGLLYRCEVDPRQQECRFGTPNKLPCKLLWGKFLVAALFKIKLEVWIGAPGQELIERKLIDEIKKMLRAPELGLPKKRYWFSGELMPDMDHHGFRLIM